MTREEREEALAIMNVIIHMIEKQYDNDRAEKAVEMAIAALKAEPCEDAVSREFMYKLGAKCIAVRTENDELVALASIESLPSVTPKQRTGKIIMGGYDCDHYVCSECGHDFGWYSKPNHKYCPNCGAKMEGESE